MLAFLANLGIGTIVSRLAAAYEAKQRAVTDSEKIAADMRIAQLEAQRDVLVAEQGWRVTAWIRPLLAYPVILHFALVVADSIFGFSWTIDALPSPMDEWEGWIVGAYFLTRPVEKIGLALVRKR